MMILNSILELKQYQKSLKGDLGFVPTMGALHIGHGKLIETSASENPNTLVSIFVNPTQFNDPNDLKKYPRTLEKDLELASQYGAQAVWLPTEAELYADQYRYRVSENSLSQKLCGAHRPGHFDGVLSVVMKLLNLTKPTRAYFGEKDYQQLLLIQDMVKVFFLDFEIKAVPTVRETDGLAFSSRNVRLNPEQRAKAPRIYQIISEAATALQANQLLTAEGFRVDYVEDLFGRRFVAAFLGEVRLIDNVKI